MGFAWPHNGTAPAGRRGSPELEGLTVAEAYCSGWGTPGTVPTPLRDWQTPELPFLFRSAPHAGGRNAPPSGRAGARELASPRGSAPRGEPEQDGGRAEAAAWAREAAARSAEPRRLGRASPGPTAPDRAQVGLPAPPSRGRSLRARPAWARGSRPPNPPTPGPTRARPLPRAPGTAPAHCPPLAARAACRRLSLIPLAWKTSLPVALARQT